MDPYECLSAAKDYLKTNRAECAGCLVAYFIWRLNGGFDACDAEAYQIVRDLGEVADTLAESGCGS